MSDEHSPWKIWEGRLWKLLGSSLYLGYSILFVKNSGFLMGKGYIDKIILSIATGLFSVLVFSALHFAYQKYILGEVDREEMVNQSIATALAGGTIVLMYAILPNIL